jgi:hypothetical protein
MMMVVAFEPSRAGNAFEHPFGCASFIAPAWLRHG